MFEVLMFLSLMACIISGIGFFYCLARKKKKKPMVIAFIVSIIAFFAFGIGYGATQTPEERAVTQQKLGQQKIAEAEKKSAKDAEKLPADIEKICKDQLGNKFIKVEILDNSEKPGTKIIIPHFKGNEGWDNDGARKNMILQTRDLFNKIFNAGLPISKVVAMVEGDLVDKYGNSSSRTVMKCTLTDTSASKINWKNIEQVDFQSVLDDVWMHPALKANN